MASTWETLEERERRVKGTRTTSAMARAAQETPEPTTLKAAFADRPFISREDLRNIARQHYERPVISFYLTLAPQQGVRSDPPVFRFDLPQPAAPRARSPQTVHRRATACASARRPRRPRRGAGLPRGLPAGGREGACHLQEWRPVEPGHAAAGARSRFAYDRCRSLYRTARGDHGGAAPPARGRPLEREDELLAL